MLRFAPCLFFSVLFWAMNPAVGRAQAVVHLTLRAERMANARAVEREALQQKDSLKLAEAWYLYGKTYVFAGEYHTAQIYFLKALHVHEARKASYELSRLYIRLSETENRLGRFSEAVAYVNRALAVAQACRSDRALLLGYGSLAQLYQEHWSAQLATDSVRFAQVLTYLRRAESLCYKLGDTMGIAEASLNIGALYIKRADPQAIDYLKKALHLFTLKNKEGIRVNAMLTLSSAYLLIGKPRLAGQLLQQADQFYASHKLNEYDLRLNLETNRVYFYEATGQWKAALDHLKKQNELERSQILADRDGAISRLNIEYETSKKEALLKAQNRELALRFESLQTQQRLIIVIAVLLAIAVGMSIGLFIYGRKHARVSRQKAELVKEQNHRVKNNLQVVSSLLSLQASRLTDEVARQAVEESQLRVQSMALLHRRLYDGERLAQVDLEEFIRDLVSGVLTTYGFLAVPVRFSMDTIYLSADKATPLGLLMNELVTNCCKYAFPGNAAPRLLIRCRQKGRTISLRVADNGPGMADTDSSVLQSDDLLVARTRTFGLMLIQAQATQLNGRARFASKQDETDHGAVFTLEFTI